MLLGAAELGATTVDETAGGSARWRHIAVTRWSGSSRSMAGQLQGCGKGAVGGSVRHSERATAAERAAADVLSAAPAGRRTGKALPATRNAAGRRAAAAVRRRGAHLGEQRNTRRGAVAPVGPGCSGRAWCQGALDRLTQAAEARRRQPVEKEGCCSGTSSGAALGLGGRRPGGYVVRSAGVGRVGRPCAALPLPPGALGGARRRPPRAVSADRL